MRHLLILLSILLLSFPLFGGETGVLFLWDTPSGQVWKTFRDKDTQPKYKGQVEIGRPNGQGTYTFNDGRKYIGNWIDGEQNGRGILTSPNGEKYEGVWKDGKQHGQGTLTFPDGTKLEDEFKEDEPWNTTGFEKDGNIFEKYVNGVEQ